LISKWIQNHFYYFKYSLLGSINLVKENKQDLEKYFSSHISHSSQFKKRKQTKIIWKHTPKPHRKLNSRIFNFEVNSSFQT
jgi:hypothetical protein